MKEDTNLNAVAEIFSSLKSPYSLRLFLLSEKGISSSTKVIKELGLTQKRYYVLLKKLIDSGLIEKRNSIYRQTLLGRVCHKLLMTLQDTLVQGDRLKLADKLLKSNTLSTKEKENVLYGTIGLVGIPYDVKTIVNYDIFIDEVIKMLDDAKETAYVVTNKTDLRVKDSTMHIIDRGVKLYFLSVEGEYSQNIEILRLLLNPTSMGLIRRLLSSRELNIRVVKDMAYCFVVTDGENGILELPHPISQKFYVAFKFKNEYLCNKLIEVFNSLYERAKEDPRIAFTKRSLGLYKDLTGKIQAIYKDED